jgi:hypothetical protein
MCDGSKRECCAKSAAFVGQYEFVSGYFSSASAGCNQATATRNGGTVESSQCGIGNFLDEQSEELNWRLKRIKGGHKIDPVPICY